MDNANPDGGSEKVPLNNSIDTENLASRKRSRSPSPSSSSSDTCSSSDERPRRSKIRKVQQTVSYAHLEYLSQQMAFLTNMISNNVASKNIEASSPQDKDQQLVNSAVNLNIDLRRPAGSECLTSQLSLSEPSTTVKDPLYARANETYVKKLIELQRFKRDDWYAVRFADTQKKYLATPGFVELNVNDSLKRFEAAMLRDDSRSYLLERSFAGLTNCLLLQKEELQRTLQDLIDWANDSKQALTPITLFDKVGSLFSKESSYIKVTDDLLQIVCGRRTDLITLRRDSLLRHIPEEYHRDVLYKIPPSEETLFSDESVQNYLQKIGGADKLCSSLEPIPRSQAKENFYQNQKPSTSKQVDNTLFRSRTSTKRRVPQQTKQKVQEKRENYRHKGKKPKTRASFKNKRRE